MDGNSKKGEHDDGYLQLKHKIDINPKLESRAARQETITDRKKIARRAQKKRKKV